jgi:CRP-like cAMP-binding protein
MIFESSTIQNRILAHVPIDAFDVLRPHLQRVQLKRHDVLQRPNRRTRQVHFIESGVATLLAHTNRDGWIEVGMVGRFGLVGVSAVLGTKRSPHLCLVEVEGQALQADSDSLGLVMDKYPSVRRQLMSYVQALLVQNSQTVLCNACHEIGARLARWLLLARDRLDDNVIPLTHDVFAAMLGVRRASITNALAELEQSGAVQRGRGAVEIVDRTALERRTCECYRIIAAEYKRLS